MAERKRQRKAGVYKYGSHYKSIRKNALKEHPYCALCGSEICLTVHHVGGGLRALHSAMRRLPSGIRTLE